MAKTKKTKIPKRIAGVKLPKDLRRKGEAILEKANSPAGREMLAAGLTMAAAAATAAVARSRETAKAPSPADVTGPAQPGQHPPAGDPIGAMAEMLLTRMFGPKKTG